MNDKKNNNNIEQMREILRKSINANNIEPGSNSWALMFKKTKEEKQQLSVAKMKWKAENVIAE